MYLDLDTAPALQPQLNESSEVDSFQLDLSFQQLTDGEIKIVANSALQNSEVSHHGFLWICPEHER